MEDEGACCPFSDNTYSLGFTIGEGYIQTEAKAKVVASVHLFFIGFIVPQF